MRHTIASMRFAFMMINVCETFLISVNMPAVARVGNIVFAFAGNKRLFP